MQIKKKKNVIQHIVLKITFDKTTSYTDHEKKKQV